MSRVPRLLALLAGAAFASAAYAAPQTYDQAQQRAIANAPALQARGLEIEAARSGARSAGALPDPRLTFGLENLPLAGGGDEMTMATVGLMQDMPSRAQRRAERTRADAEIGVAEAGLAIEARRVRLATALAWVDLYYAERRLQALDGVLRTLEPLWSAQPSSVASGAIRPAQAIAPVRMRAQLEDQRDELLAAAGRARSELARWTGDASPSTAGPPPALDVDGATLKAALERNPNLRMYASATERAEADVELARAGTRPDWTWEVSYGRRDPMFGDMVSVGGSVRLPLFKSKRQEPIIAARRADVARVGAEREDARQALLAQLDADMADHAMHHAQWHRALQTLSPAAQQQADLETASYAAGRAGLAEVIEAFVQVAEVKLLTLEREAAVARDSVRIVLAYRGDDQ
jgi:outer membrane protein, heavy metal efflux system